VSMFLVLDIELRKLCQNRGLIHVLQLSLISIASALFFSSKYALVLPRRHPLPGWAAAGRSASSLPLLTQDNLHT
jgi:hypothetical protein